MLIPQRPTTQTIPFRLLASGQAVLIAVTWPLWTPQSVFPQIPLIQFAGYCPPSIEWLLLFGLLVSAVIGMISNQLMTLRIASFASMFCSLALALVDQHRLQPWAWEFLIISFVLSFADSAASRQLWQWLVIGIYTWSAWSKIDYGFCLQHGPFLLDGICKAIPMLPATQTWPDIFRFGLSAAIPVFEFAIAAGLCWNKTRHMALVGAAIMHIGLLLALGPFGHNHKPGVLVWNVFFLVQNWILFGRQSAASNTTQTYAQQTTTTDASGDTKTSDQLSGTAWGNVFARLVVIAAMVWPASESFGFCDHWAAWAVYAANPERASILINRNDVVKLPDDLRRYLSANNDEDEWLLLRIDRWSLDTVDAPIYPQDRFQVGVALDLLKQFDLDQMQIVIEGPANRWNGRRTIRRYEDTNAITELAMSYRLNTISRGNYLPAQSGQQFK